MSANENSLLLRIRGDSSGGKAAVAETRQAIAGLRTSATNDLKAIQSASTSSLGSITQAAGQLTQNIPIVGRAISGLSTAFTSITTASEGTAAGIAGLAPPIVAGTLVLGLLTSGIIVAGRELFSLTKQTAEFRGKFIDLSQQVGVAVETLSTLDIATSTTGGNINTVAASMGIFQKNLEAAHDPTSKEAKLLTELGVTSLDTEVALRQTLKGLFALGEGGKQTSAVLELFGRSGRFVNAILKETEGDLDKATEQFRRMGLIVSTESAAAADQFNDLLEIISRQLTSVTHQIVNNAIPVFIIAFQDISKALTGNQDSWQSWSRGIETAVALSVASIEAFVQFVATRFTADFGALVESNFDSIIRRAQRLRNELFAQSEIEKFGRITDQILGRAGRVGDRPDIAKATNEAQIRAAKEIQLAQRELDESIRVRTEILKRDRQLDLKSIEEWEKESIDILVRHLGRSQDIWERERENARRFVTDREELSQKLREIDLKDEKAQNDFTLTVQRVQDESIHRRAQSDIKIEQQLAAVRESQREGEIAALRRSFEAREITEAEFLTGQLELLRETYEDRALVYGTELKQITTSSERRTELINLLIELEQRFTDETKRLIEDRNQARESDERQYAERLKGIHADIHAIELESAREAIGLMILNFTKRRDIIRAQTELLLREADTRHQRFAEDIRREQEENDERIRVLNKLIEALRAAGKEASEEYKKATDKRIKALEIQKALNDKEIAELERLRREKKRIKDEGKKDEEESTPLGRITINTDDLKEFAKTIEDSIVPLGDLLTRTFLQVADAIGQTVQNWVLLGETGPAVMRKILAQALASIAAEAAVNAIKELALGFAMLFINPAESGAHFTAAALWASIGGVAAIAGRGVAGDLFKPKSAASGGGSSAPRPLDTVVEQGRNQRPPPVVHINVTHAEGMIVKTVIDDFNNGGITRETMRRD